MPFNGTLHAFTSNELFFFLIPVDYNVAVLLCTMDFGTLQPLRRGVNPSAQSIYYSVVFSRQIGHMAVEQTEKFMPPGPSTSWAQNRINVFSGPIFKRPMICQDQDLLGANRRLVLFQSADYGVRFLLTRRPLHLA